MFRRDQGARGRGSFYPSPGRRGTGRFRRWARSRAQARVEPATEAVRAAITPSTTTPGAWSKPGYAELPDRIAGLQEAGSAGLIRGWADAMAALGPAAGRPSRGAGGTLATAPSVPTCDEAASGIPSARYLEFLPVLDLLRDLVLDRHALLKFFNSLAKSFDLGFEISRQCRKIT